jgi:GT2 family glycosyltransferase
MTRLTVGIVTKNRPDTLRRCLSSLALIADVLAEVIVVDDTSDEPIDETLRQLPPTISSRLRTIRQMHHEGYIVARNRIMREASSEHVLLMDDDAWLLDGACIFEALTLIDGHDRVGAVAFAMATVDGGPWEARMQPAAVNYACLVPSFIGFAHLLRRRIFLELGGYDEAFHFYGEEKSYCLRLIDAGFDVVYLPHARVVHAPHSAGRNTSKYVRYVIRNDCLGAMRNEPLPLAAVSVPLRLGRYLTMRRAIDDRGGLRWIVGDLVSRLPDLRRTRRPVRWSTIAKWRRLRRQSPRWTPYRDDRRAPPSDGAPGRTITVGITTSNRPQRLTDCLRSLALVGDLVSAIIVVDDASEVPARDAIGPLPTGIAEKLTIIRQPEPSGNISCRNVAMRHAATDEVLLLDDDTALIEADTIRRGLALMDRDAAIAAVGFAMASPDGAPLPSLMQPSPARYVCYVPSYIGFAHLIRRGPFFQVGGYRELFQRHGEEKECCLRLMDAGYDIVFMPDPPIVHHVDPAGRNLKRYLRIVVRNDCLGALYNEPLPLLVCTLPIRLFRYIKMRRKAGVSDPGGFVWILSELTRHFHTVVRERRPVQWATMRRWRRLRRQWPAYDRPAAA